MVFNATMMNEENLGNHESEWVEELKTRHFFFWPTMNKMQTNFDNISAISWWSVLLVEETGGPGENQRPVASHGQTLSHNALHLALTEIVTENTTLFLLVYYEQNAD
jgi:hypothetical protein